MRQLKYQEQKLLKKVDFLQWKNEDNLRVAEILRRYHIQDREDYVVYKKLAQQVRVCAQKLMLLDPRDEFRISMTDKLLDKLYNMGVLPMKKSLAQCEALTASAFCRRRLPVVMFRMKFTESIKEAVVFIEQGHIRVGPEVITDPAFLVTRLVLISLFIYCFIS